MTDLMQQNVKALRATAKALGVGGAAQMRKADLVAAIRAAQEQPAPAAQPPSPAGEASAPAGDGPADEAAGEAAQMVYEHVYRVDADARTDRPGYFTAARTAAIQRGFWPIGDVTLARVEDLHGGRYRRLVFAVPVTRAR